jgi:hypothetical protein
MCVSVCVCVCVCVLKYVHVKWNQWNVKVGMHDDIA